MSNFLTVKRVVVGPLYVNCYLVYDKNTLKGMLIDPGEYSQEIETYVKRNAIDLIGIINTHGHADHMAGNKAYNLPVFIHELDADYLTDSRINLSIFLGIHVAEVKAAGFLKDGDIIEIGNFKLKVIHTPGHSPGGISIVCGDILFSGDTLFCEGVGRTDLSGGSQTDLMRSIQEKLFVLPDSTKVYPGHGPETTIGNEKKFMRGT
ncbi:MAG: MBL fold metallo-hydrolase [Candidatus Omnitrophota bacterium]